MNLIEYHNTEFKIRSVDIDGNPWFVAKDVCSALGLENSSHAISGLDEDEKGVTNGDPLGVGNGVTNGNPLDTKGGRQNFAIVNESGLYALIFKSRKPDARLFRRWVTGEVLPAIRRDGVYRLTRIDKSRIKQLEQGIEEMKHGLEKKREHFWRVQHIPGNVPLTLYLAAAGVEIESDKRRQITGRLGSRSREYGFPIGRVRMGTLAQRFGSMIKTKHAYHSIATYPQLEILAVLRELNYDVPVPTPDALASVWDQSIKNKMLRLQ